MVLFGVISDIHMRTNHADSISERLSEAVSALDEAGSEHLFILGDFIEGSNSRSIDEENVNRVRSIVEGASFPVTYLLGNHDTETLTKSGLAELLSQESFYGTVELDETPIIYLDSSSSSDAGPQGRLGAKQRGWLEKELQRYSNPAVLVHHPIGSFSISDNPWFRDYPERAFLGDRKEVLDLLCDNESVLATISGHIHSTQYSRFRGILHASINAFSKEQPKKPVTGTYAEVSISSSRGFRVETKNGDCNDFASLSRLQEHSFRRISKYLVGKGW